MGAKKKIKALWLSINQGLYHSNRKQSYNGGGWISSIQALVQNSPDIELAMAFLTPEKRDAKCTIEGTQYYPIYAKPLGKFKKLMQYYRGYRHIDEFAYVEDIKRVIDDFHPDIIHLFGMENPMSTILGKTSVPIVVHLQGLLAAYDNAFFPIDTNESTFMWPFTVREWILRNGYIYAKKLIHVRGNRERQLFKNVRYTMGRTHWDYEVSQLLAPASTYFHVDEVMRPCFYEHSGTSQTQQKHHIVIISTLSETIYKGLDLVLKTASLLEQETAIDFEWRVIGIEASSNYVKFFEKFVSMKTTRIRYMGVLNAYELCSNLIDSTIYVHPSYIDNSPNSVCEAQLVGLPVIATNVGGVASLIEDENTGLLVPANAPYELAYKIKRLVSDKHLYQRIAQQGCEAAKSRHDREKILYDLQNAYQAILTHK